MKKWDIKGAEPAHSEVDTITSWLLGEEVQNSLSAPSAQPPILSLTSFWHVSPTPNHLPPSHCHLFMTRCVTSRLPDDFRSREWANPFEQFNQIQKDLDHLRNWASRWWMQFKVQKCRIITRGESNTVCGWGKWLGRQAHRSHYLDALEEKDQQHGSGS